MAKWWPFGRKKTPKSARTYAGADIGRLVASWVATGTSADTEIKASLTRLRDRSRQLERDNDYVKNGIREIRNNVIGEGIKLQSQVRMQRGDKLNTTLNDQIEWEWYKWCKKDSCDTSGKLSFQEIERLVIGDAAVSGEVFIRLIEGVKFGSSKVPFALEVIEADYLDETHNGVSDTGNEIRMGIELDSWGRPIAYYFRKKHPGDVSPQGAYSRSEQRIRVLAREVIHLGVFDRSRQTRCVPWVASAMLRLHHMHGYEQATVVGARAAASLMGFIQTPNGELEGDAVQDGDRVTEFEPGTFKKLNPGEEVHVPNISRPTGELDPFMRLMLRGVAAGLGQSYETVSKDYSNTSYSSARSSILSERDNWRVLQKWMIRNFHQVIFQRWLDFAVLSGRIQLPNYFDDSERYYDAVRWIPRGWSWVDPVKEIAAAKEAIRNGLQTQTEIVAERGGDFEELVATRKRELEIASAAGLVFDTDPSVMQANGAKHPAPSEIDPSAENADQANAPQ